MSPDKRAMDVVISATALIALSPVLVFLWILIVLVDGRPAFYISERMRSVDRGFQLVKFRTMAPVASDAGVSGADKADRVTRTGKVLRRLRLDELPQLWNVLVGDMSLVGPRPPLREYVRRFPALYGQVLQTRPGVTGLASVVYHRHEERLLAKAITGEDTDRIYSRACVPRKARLDLIYSQNRTLKLDILIMIKTVFRKVPLRYRR